MVVDPFSAAGLGFAVTSLTFQIFAGCVKGYQLLASARGMPETYKYLILRLKTEQYRLLDWAEIVKLDEGMERLARADPGLINDVIHQQYQLIHNFGRYEKRGSIFKPVDKPLLEVDDSDDTFSAQTSPIQQSNTGFESGDDDGSDVHRRFPRRKSKLLSTCLEYVKKSNTYPRRLKWAAIDAKTFEQLLQRLTHLNDFLRGMLTESELQHLTSLQIQTGHEIVQLNNKVDQLLQLFQACQISFVSQVVTQTPVSETSSSLRMTVSTGAVQASGPTAFAEHIADLSRYKALSTSSGNETSTGYEDIAKKFDQLSQGKIGRSQNPEKTEIEWSRIELLGIYDNPAKRAEGRLRTDGKSDRPVWIEWKTFDPDALNEPDASENLIHRVQILAALLKEDEKPPGFRAPDCLGFFRDQTGENRVGFVFAKPKGVLEETEPLSLLSILERDFADGRKPSLTDRAALSTAIVHCVEHLHSVNWLHKGLRSDNIVFFPGKDGKVDYRKPYLAGFDYARPSRRKDWTEKPKQNAEYDIYRHPNAHGENPISFRKTYDLYALGVLLIEIGHWQPLHEILGLKNYKNAKPSETRNVYNLLTVSHDETHPKKVPLGALQSGSGDRFFEATKACLLASQELLTEDVLDRDLDETSPEVGEALQRSFYEAVVVKLSQIVV